MRSYSPAVLKLMEEGEALALEFERKAETRRSKLSRLWYRRAARKLRKDLRGLYDTAF